MQIEINGLTIGSGTDFEIEGSVEGLEKPQIRTSSQNYSGRDGGRTNGQYYGSRLITVSGFIRPQTCEQHELDRKLLDTSLPIRQDLDVNITTFAGHSYSTTARLIDFKMPIKNPVLSSFKIDLLSGDVNLYTATQSQVIPIAQTGGFTLPTDVPIIFAPGSNPTIITNTGEVEAYPTITIVGEATAPIKILNNATNQYVEMNVTSGVSDEIVIDMLNRTATLNGSSIRSYVTNAGWFSLAVGQTPVSYSTGDLLDTGVATLTWKTAVRGI